MAVLIAPPASWWIVSAYGVGLISGLAFVALVFVLRHSSEGYYRTLVALRFPLQRAAAVSLLMVAVVTLIGAL